MIRKMVLYDDVANLRDRLLPDGSGEIYENDHLVLAEVLDLLEEYLNTEDEE
jgi:hypothetical protein